MSGGLIPYCRLNSLPNFVTIRDASLPYSTPKAEPVFLRVPHVNHWRDVLPVMLRLKLARLGSFRVRAVLRNGPKCV